MQNISETQAATWKKLVDILSYRTSSRLNNLHLFDPHSIPVTLCIVFGLIIVFLFQFSIQRLNFKLEQG